jgi:hypothetical protein
MMPKTTIVLCVAQKDFDGVAALIDAGADLVYPPIATSNGVVYHLIDDQASQIVSVAEVELSRVDTYLAQGYIVKKLKDATAVVIKKK